MEYHEYAASGEYLHLLSLQAWADLRPRLAAALAGVDPDAGPVLELGAGSGLAWWIVTADGLAAELADAGLVPTVADDLVVARKGDA